MTCCQEESTCGSPLAKLNDQELQKLQENVDKYVVFCEDLLETRDKKFILKFHGATQKRLYITMYAYEKDPSYLFEFSSVTGAFNILTNLINEKYYNQLRSSVKCNRLDHQGDHEDEEVGDNLGNLSDEQKDESSSGPQMERMILRTHVGEDGSMKSEVGVELTFIMDITHDGSPSKIHVAP